MTLIPDDQIREMQERAEKATPGLWDVDVRCDGSNVDMFPEANEDYVLAEFNGCVDPNDGYNNAVFASHARTDIPKLLAERKELLAERDRLAVAIKNLTAKLDEVHANPEYQSVWMLAQLHRGPYSGPKYDTELEAARRAVEWQAEQQPVAAQKGTEQA